MSLALVFVLPLRVLLVYDVCGTPHCGREAVVLGGEGPGMTTTPTSKTARRRRPARLRARARLCRCPRLLRGLLSQSWSLVPEEGRCAVCVVGHSLPLGCVCEVECSAFHALLIGAVLFYIFIYFHEIVRVFFCVFFV